MRIGVMCSGNGTNFENIVRTCREDEVVVMVHNKKKCGAAKRASKLGIPHTQISSKSEDTIIQIMQAWKVDLIVLAGWMRIVTPKLITAFPNRIINLHPSMLPKYKGLHAIERALDSGDEMTGVSVHFVNEELDGGEVILQSEVPILPGDDLETLTKAIQRREYYLLPKAIEYVKQGLPVASH
jgi:formyltetrahydrofolate-dependent phosphoribosylglycinamide formyltransferase